MLNINIVSSIILILFAIPVIAGLIAPFSRERVLHSLSSLLDNLEFICGLILSVYLTKKIFFEHQTGIFKIIYNYLPAYIREELYGRDIAVYMLVVPVLLLIVLFLLRLLTSPAYKYIIVPASDILFRLVRSMNAGVRKLAGAVWNIPKSVFLVFLFALLLNFYSYYFSTPGMAKTLNESRLYQLIYQNGLYPILNSNVAKQIPVLLNDSFKAVGTILPDGADGAKTADSMAGQFSKGNFSVIEYFNGVTLDQAIQSNDAIDTKAQKIAGSEANTRKKANLLYRWVSDNIEYDYNKARMISANSKGMSSGSVTAFEERKGICFDYSCLYISMCRAVGLKVRLVTGLGYSGISWGDHAWNQVYCKEENRWINVDCTFGSAADYFDKPDFTVDHRYAEIQGEW